MTDKTQGGDEVDKVEDAKTLVGSVVDARTETRMSLLDGQPRLDGL